MTQKNANKEMTGLEAMKMLLEGGAVYDFWGIQYERIDNNIYQKCKRASGQEYYVLCTLPINTFINQVYYKDKK